MMGCTMIRDSMLLKKLTSPVGVSIALRTAAGSLTLMSTSTFLLTLVTLACIASLKYVTSRVWQLTEDEGNLQREEKLRNTTSALHNRIISSAALLKNN